VKCGNVVKMGAKIDQKLNFLNFLKKSHFSTVFLLKLSICQAMLCCLGNKDLYFQIRNSAFQASYDEDGTFSVIIEKVFEERCPMNFADYPFDEHNCSWSLMPLDFSNDEMEFIRGKIQYTHHTVG
jgi:hypothetical protein